MSFNSYPRLLSCGNTLNCGHISRGISKYLQKDISSKAIRQHFLDYFLQSQEHAFVRSSPVVPYCDHTVPFVNAGMNQFKGIFLGTQTPHFTRVANTQKCVRVGGKHNDINIVGKDGYHHTFFEMMGNWSFGDYFKEEACKMAWELLTQVYKIPPSRLYVTYFGGDSNLGLESDVETKEIWKKIGLQDERILPFGAKDNFWEMGMTGPCGPCTELHFDHIGTNNRAEFVNKDLHDLTEIWNLVFIQYHRLPNGSIEALPKKHVDTGLGLERLCCALQGCSSTYDTDLFQYLIKAIEKNCKNIQNYSGKFGEQDWNDVDTAYRILADHVRMLTICLADGVIPEQNQKLKRVIRKCFILSESVFKKEKGLIKELSNYIVENLGPVYPELEKNISQIHQILDYEEEVYSTIRSAAKKAWHKLDIDKQSYNLDNIDITPSFVKAFKELHAEKPSEIDGELAHRLYDTHGFDSEAIEQLAQILNIRYDPKTFEKKMEEIRLKSKKSRPYNSLAVDLKGLQPTDDSAKYAYDKRNGKYHFPDSESKLLQIVDSKGNFVNDVSKGASCSLILERTNLYTEAGGQECDEGVIKCGDAFFHVDSIVKINNVVMHKGHLRNGALKVGDNCKVFVDESRRLSNMRNHTSAHLLNAAVKKVKNACCQKSSKVTDRFVNLDVSVFGPKLNLEDIGHIEEVINKVIKESLNVRVNVTDSQGLYSLDQITLIPGEVYPESDIRVIEIDNEKDFVSREPCCGTHVLNTGDIDDFCIVNVKSLGRSTSSVYAVSGDRAKLARKNAADLDEDILIFKKSVNEYLDKPEMLDMAIVALKQRLVYDVSDESVLPYLDKNRALENLNSIKKYVKEKCNEDLRNFVDLEVQDALNNKIERTKSKRKYMVLYLRSSMMLKSVPLQRATNMCSEIPVIVIAYSDSIVKARCCVPEEFRTENFDAAKWLNETVAKVFDGEISSQKSQNGVLVCNMKEKRIHVQNWHQLLEDGIKNAKEFVNERL